MEITHFQCGIANYENFRRQDFLHLLLLFSRLPANTQKFENLVS